MLFYVPSTEVVDASTRAYNDWLADFCSEDAQRLRGVAMLNVDDPGTAVTELERCAARGLAGALITVAPPPWQPFGSGAYDRLWAAASDLAMPLSLHVASDRADPKGGAFTLDARRTGPSLFVNHDHQVREALAELVLTGVFERFPALRIGSVEHGLGWIPYFLTRWTSRTRSARIASTGTGSRTPAPCPATTSGATCSPASRRTAWVYGCAMSSAST
jgi:predicted TIM-barrel fold metal-dependent hydrolase